MKRRQFLTLSCGGVGAALLGQCEISKPQQVLLPSSASNPATSASAKTAAVRVDLEARETLVDLGGREVSLLTYNGQVPGPRIEARPGDTVRIQFVNRLPNPTNLHYHGLHVPPTGSADNVFLDIPSGQRFTYDFSITDNHPAGTFYYHPHRHGHVADQVFGGLGGIFVVRGALDEIPEVKAAREEFVFLKDFAVEDDFSSPMHMGRMVGREGNVVTANGQVNPSFTIAENGWLRLRLVNASNARFYRLALEEHTFQLIATDGGAIERPVELSELLLAPGERAEVLVQGNRAPGKYRLLDLPYDRGGMGLMGGGPRGMGRGPRGMGRGRHHRGRAAAAIAVATVNYSSRVDAPLPLPQQLVSLTALPEPEVTRRFTLNHGMFPGRGMAFLIDDRAFDAGRIDTEVALGTVEDWEIVNTGVMDHPFHLHTNPFQIVSRDGIPEEFLARKDTVIVRPGETVRIRIKFEDYPGMTVYHCHILDHEELGMMAVVNMTRPA